MFNKFGAVIRVQHPPADMWRSGGAPEPDGALKAVTRAKIRHYRQLYLNRPDPIVFAYLTVTVDTSDHIYDDFSRLLFLHPHREVSAW